MTHQLTPSLQLTTEHSASSQGIPVLVRDKSQLTGEGEGYSVHGPADVFEYGGQRWPAAKHVLRFAKLHPDNTELQEAAATFCRSTDLEHDLKFQLGEVQNILDEVRHILGARDGEGSTYAAERVVQQRNRLFEALENTCPSDQTSKEALEAAKPFVT